MHFLLYTVSAFAAYLIGSFSPSIFLSRSLLGRDVRKQGSGNAGATNMARVYGMGFGVVTLLCDALKAVAAIAFAVWLLGEWGIFVGGIFCLLGHCFPVFYGFKGGKGVSVGAVVALAVDWRAFVVVVVVFALGAVLTRKVSVGSVLAAISIAPAALIIAVSTPKLLLAIFGSILVTARHAANIERVVHGEEPDFHAAEPKKFCFKVKRDKK